MFLLLSTFIVFLLFVRHDGLVWVIPNQPVCKPHHGVGWLVLAELRESGEQSGIHRPLQVLASGRTLRDGLQDGVGEEEPYFSLGSSRVVTPVDGVPQFVRAIQRTQAVRVALPSLLAVSGSHELLPEFRGSVPSQNHGQDGTGAHVRHQAGENHLAKVLAVQLAALLGAEVHTSAL